MKRTTFIDFMLYSSLMLILAVMPSKVLGSEPAYGNGITLDGDQSDWNLNTDFFADMYLAGNPTRTVLSKFYSRYSCQSNRLYIMVLDVVDDDLIVDNSPDEAWLKIYDISNSTLVCGNSNDVSCDFEWIYSIPGDANSIIIGFEAYIDLALGMYSEIEAHLNIDGETSSTGKRNQGNAIPLYVHCDFEVAEAQEELQRFDLKQNYPNPFNPTTTIDFSLDQTGFVRMGVYNFAGQEVATLVNEIRASGPNSVVFDATNLSSGMYFYRMDVEGKSQTSKLILMK
jgi:hypothetical protein